MGYSSFRPRGVTHHEAGRAFAGYTVYCHLWGNQAYAVAMDGSIAHTWDVPNGWKSWVGNEGGWGALPAGPSTTIKNRPGPNDIYSVPQNIGYSTTGVQRERLGEGAQRFLALAGLLQGDAAQVVKFHLLGKAGQQVRGVGQHLGQTTQ